MLQKIYRSLFWAGYFLVLITAFINIAGSFNDVHIGKGLFKIRMDHLIHFTVYFLICLFYLAGQRKSLSLFSSNPLKKFILLILLLATVTELVQLWVPERSFNILDWIANISGMSAGLIAIKIFEKHNSNVVSLL
jgi:VanZ family protein